MRAYEICLAGLSITVLENVWTCSAFLHALHTAASISVLFRMLPVPAGCKLTTVPVCVCVCLLCVQGLRTEVMERVAHLSFQDATIIIHGHDSLNTAALITTLGQLEQLHTTGRTIVDFVDWQWDAESLRALIASLPDLQHLTISAAVEIAGPLTDELLGVVLQLGSRVRSLSVPSLALQSDQHISAVWPWHSLTVDSLDVSQLALLPCPKGGGHTGRIVKCEDVRLDDTVTKVSCFHLCTRFLFAHVSCCLPPWCHYKPRQPQISCIVVRTPMPPVCT